MRRLWYPVDRVVRRSMWTAFRHMDVSQGLSWHEAAASKLEKLLSWCRVHVPAYRDVGSASDDSKTADILALLDSLPIVTRRDLTDDPGRYTSDSLPRSAHWNSTGGSTGIPLRILQDSRYGAATTAGSCLFYTWVGWRPTDRILKIWGSFAEAVGEHPGLKRRFLNWLYGQPQLDAFALRAGDAARYIDFIQRVRPEVFLSYVDAAESLAQYIDGSGRRLGYTPRGIVVTAGTLFPEWRQDIERAFGCPVFNRYSSREAGCIACSHGNDPLYVNPFTHVVEVVDAEGRRITHGTGRILVTVLENYSMPLIRYDIGDYATIESGESLYPEDGWQRLESVDGRQMTMLQGPHGNRFSPILFVMTIGVYQNKGLISQYQVVQRGMEKYTIRLMLAARGRPEDSAIHPFLDDLRRDLLRVLGVATQIEFEFVDQVETLPSGKVPVCIVRLDDGSRSAGPELNARGGP